MSDALPPPQQPQPPSGWQPPAPTSPGYAPPPPTNWQVPPTLPPPPGTPGYGYGYTPYGPAALAKPISGLSVALSVLLALAGVAAVVAAAALFNRWSVLGSDFLTDFQKVEDADNFVQAAGVMSGIVTLAAGIVWIVWHYRYAQNADVLGKRGGLSAGWAIAGWVPLLSLVLGPLQLVQSTQASDPETPGGRGRVPGVVVVWWVLYAGQALIGFASGRYVFRDEGLGSNLDLEEFRASDRLGGIAALVTAAAAVAAILTVQTVTKRQRAALAARGATV